jgi:S1-C subfamily serine protease
MKKSTVTAAIFLLGLPLAHGQLRPPRIPQADKEVTDSQAAAIFKTLRAVNFEARKVAFPIYSGRERVAYGVSIGNGRLLTKASEVTRRVRLFTTIEEGGSVFCRVVGVYPDQDLAVLEVPGLTAPAAKWVDASNLEEGAFLVAMGEGGEAYALGVLSVQERSLKSTDQGFLGIQMDSSESGEGVAVREVVPKSAAAEVGIRPGDVIVSIGGQKITGFFELSTRLRRMKSGEQPVISLKRGDQEVKVTPTLKARTAEEGTSARLQRMDRMSGSQSRVRGEFANVMQSDMELEARDAGMPVVDLEGRVVGMVIARAGRISTLILPGDDVAKILEKKPEVFEPAAPRVAQRNERERGQRRQRMQRELERMREMMENLQRELERE